MQVKKRLRYITAVYWIFLLYIIAALVWWFIALERQNTSMIRYRQSEIPLSHPSYQQQFDRLENAKSRKTTQYAAEGLTFLALILLGAVFVYRAIRRQFALQQQQENFMMAITHELKTPIAIAKLNLETLQKHQLDPEKRQKLIGMTLQETNRLNALASNILVSAQLEASRKITREEINFSDLVNGCAHEFKNRFPDRPWQIDIDEEIEVAGDPLLLQILVNNLLENAVKYSPPGTPVYCSLKKDHHAVLLRVADEGFGIPVHERSLVFDKFYRIGREQTRSTKGTGLGLYLCRKIAADHHAVIKIEDNMPAGTIFSVKFPSIITNQHHGPQ